MASSGISCSVITPSLNQLRWLQLCVASVGDQGGVTVQHVVQDAGSTDGTPEWLRQRAGIELFVEPDEGMYDALNRGFRRVQGEVVAWLNCDEQYLPGTLARVAAFFAQHPDVDMVFGDIVMVDEHGQYLCHRKVQVPRLYHTLTCHLSTLSCAMFFRRRLVGPGGFFFNPEYRIGGDAEWMTRLLRAGVRMQALEEFTSVFTRTGANLSRDARAAAEQSKLAGTAPGWVRAGRPLWLLHHRIRRWWAGAYRQRSFAFSLYAQASPARRVERRVERPVFRQNW